MSTSTATSPRGPWPPQEVAREERATRKRVMRDRERGVTANLEEAAAFARASNVFAQAFKRDPGA
ncbi:MAG TPA: hypothetical protein VIG42_03415 [Solirubrobacteraceae bacterium]